MKHHIRKCAACGQHFTPKPKQKHHVACSEFCAIKYVDKFDKENDALRARFINNAISLREEILEIMKKAKA